MKKLFISADIEGTCGILNWDETEKSKADYGYFVKQMTREVSAACLGAMDSGFTDIVVRDAHDSARNLLPDELPEGIRLLRGWAGDPYCMMTGLDSSFDGVVFTGYHSAAFTDFNPLAHTMSGRLFKVTINGEVASETMLNALTASYEGVPVFALTGDEGLCKWMQSVSPNTAVVPVSQGMGAASLSLHPHEAVRRIRDTVREAVTRRKEDCLFPLPDRFKVSVTYKEHAKAYANKFYPGVVQTDAYTLSFEQNDYYEVLRTLHFIL